MKFHRGTAEGLPVSEAKRKRTICLASRSKSSWKAKGRQRAFFTEMKDVKLVISKKKCSGPNFWSFFFRMEKRYRIPWSESSAATYFEVFGAWIVAVWQAAAMSTKNSFSCGFPLWVGGSKRKFWRFHLSSSKAAYFLYKAFAEKKNGVKVNWFKSLVPENVEKTSVSPW